MTHRMGTAVSLAVCAALVATAAFAQKKPAPPAAKLFTTPLTIDEMTGKQAVIETTLGRIVIDLLPAQAPNHVGYFIKLAREGAYDGTTFHRLVARGIIQGGDPLSKDPAKAAQYGTGGLRVLAFEPGAGTHVAGAVSSVLLPGNKNSAGAQFFICVVPQPALDGQYTMFGKVVEGIGIAQLISETPVDEAGKAATRVEMTSVTIRDALPPGVEPFSTEPVEELASYRATLETSLGAITLELLPEKAPNTVRNFLRLASTGVYDRTSFHRVVPAFMIQAGYLGTKQVPMDESQKALVRTLEPEFNDTPHEKGVVSMARGQDRASASTSFFIMTTRVSSFDGIYTAFARVVDGMSVVEAIEQAPRDGEAPAPRIDLLRVRVSKK
ncbi:MAG TPA: peptidylprolyl isomerase [Vicinamibacterales bacterium]|nr:peptidylprolyl isomerase [Vicinamibacterales bacterium]HOQ60732.1 peptidylprolyl isomerase [Vicinamibacterales bacterium]